MYIHVSTMYMHEMYMYRPCNMCGCTAGEPNEFGQRQEVMALCCLMALQFQIYNTYDPKLTKQVWDLHKKVTIVPL